MSVIKYRERGKRRVVFLMFLLTTEVVVFHQFQIYDPSRVLTLSLIFPGKSESNSRQFRQILIIGNEIE